MNTLLLTGLPRSGAALACTLLNQMRDVLALCEPIPLADLTDRSAALAAIAEFARSTRERVLREGIAPTSAPAWDADDLAEPPRPDGGPRAVVREVRTLRIEKSLSPAFVLGISQPALFAALARELKRSFAVYAVVRSPLAALASWQTLEPRSDEGYFAAGRMDPALRVRLDKIPDRIDRQVELMAWYLSAFMKLPERQVIRFEDLTRSPASQLSLISSKDRYGVGGVRHPIHGQAPENRYPSVDFALLAGRLRRILPLIEHFYPGYGKTLDEAEAGGPVRVRRGGIDGRGKTRIDFFIVGAQKAGTTAAASYLAVHPAIRMGNRKELHFFDQSREDWREPDYDRYHTWFQPSRRSAQVLGEATPIYMYLPRAMERLHAYNPDAKLIVLLRHPSFRAHSHWSMQIGLGRETLDFSRAIRDEGRIRVAQAQNGADRQFSYVERGFYGLQIGRLLELFPRRQCCFVRTDRLRSAGDATLQEIQAFLGVDPIALESRSRRASRGRDYEPMSAADRAHLDGLFEREILQAQELTGLDLSDWLAPDYAEPRKTQPVVVET